MRYYLKLVLFLMVVNQGCQPAQSSQEQASDQNMKIDTLSQRRTLDSLLARATKFQNKNQVDSAMFYFERAQPLVVEFITDGNLLMTYFFNLGKLNYSKSNYFSADVYYEMARAMGEKSNATPEQIIPVYLESIRSKVQTKDLATALSMAQFTHKLILKNRPEDLSLMIRSQTQFVNIYYYQKNYSKGIETLNRIISMYQRAGREGEIDRQYFNIAQFCVADERPQQALSNINRAIAISMKRDGQNSKSVSDQYLVKGQCFRELGRNDSAEFYYRKTFEIRRKIFNKNDVNVFGIAYTLGTFFTSIERFDSAQRYYQQSLMALLKDFHPYNWRMNPVPQTAECNTDLFIVLKGKAELLKKIADQDTMQTELLHASLKTFLLADSVMGVYRKNSVYDDSQQALKDQYQISYEMVMDVAYSLYRKTGKPEYLENALRVMEGSRATLLQEALQRAKAFNVTGLPPNLKQKENELVRRRASLLASLEMQGRQDFMDSIHDQLLKVNGEERRLLAEINKTNPSYLSLKNADHSSSLDLLKRQVKLKDATYLEYLWGEHSIYLLVVSASDAQLRRIERNEKFNLAFRVFLSEIDSRKDSYISKIQFRDFCESAFFLYQQLVGAFIEGQTARRMIISADGPLASFPFDALITRLPISEEVDYRLPYVVNSNSVNYVYSSGLLAFEKESRDRDDKLLAFGFGGESLSSSERDDREGLPGSIEEIAVIRKIMRNHSNRFYLEQDATEHQFKKEIGSFDIVHLAIHGAADTVNTLQSRLVFRSPGDSQEDGQLFAHELYDLDLGKLDLAVLSACESGIGKSRVGEGMMSMARGFAYAGCPSMVISLWKIDDRMAARVMGGFYSYLSEGEDIDRALADAKVDFLAKASEFNSHPRYWAAFMQVGEIKPIRGGMSWMMITGLIFIVLILLLFFYRRMKIRS